MAYVFYRSATVNLQDANAVKKGTDCVYLFTVEDSNGPVDLTGKTVRSEFRNVKTLQPGSATTDCPQPTVTISNALGGEITMEIPHAQTQISPIKTTGFYSIEVVETVGGKVCEVFQGAWSLDDEATGA